MPRKKKRSVLVQDRVPWLFIGPALAFLIVFSIIPILLAFSVSFTDLDFYGLMNFSNMNFIGLENYFELFKDVEFQQCLVNMLIYAVTGVPLVLVLSFVIALLLSKGESKLFEGYRVIYYLPYLTNVVAVAVVFTYLFNSKFGLLNYLLDLLGLPPVMWLLEPVPAKISVILLAVWRSLGINIMIFLAAIKNIPTALFEAADIDGASSLRKTLSIVVPLVKFAAFYVSMTSVIIWLQLFEEPFVLTNGGPLNSTKSVVQFTYEKGFMYNTYGYAAAASVLLFLLILVFTVVQNVMRSKSEE